MYNVELYIGKCLNSCLRQEGARLGVDYEIICINDGSPDNSSTIAKGIAANYANGISVIDQKNEGLSGARNKGIEYAKGEYLWFVDSDDWIEDNCLSDILKMLKSDIDLLQIEYRLAYDNSDKNTLSLPNPVRGMTNGIQQTIAGGLHTPAQFVICRKAYLDANNLRFKEGIYHEDGEFRPRSVLNARRIMSLDKVCYNYYQRQSGSIMSNFNKKNVTDLFIVMNGLYKLALSQEKKVKVALYTKLGSYFNTLLYGIYTSNSVRFEDFIELFEQNVHLFKAIMKCSNYKYIIEGAAFRLNIKIGYALYRKLR